MATSKFEDSWEMKAQVPAQAKCQHVFQARSDCRCSQGSLMRTLTLAILPRLVGLGGIDDRVLWAR
jgi:hypothetical protein